MEPASGIPVHMPAAANPPAGAAGGGGTNPAGSPAARADACWLFIAMMPATMATIPADDAEIDADAERDGEVVAQLSGKADAGERRGRVVDGVVLLDRRVVSARPPPTTPPTSITMPTTRRLLAIDRSTAATMTTMPATSVHLPSPPFHPVTDTVPWARTSAGNVGRVDADRGRDLVEVHAHGRPVQERADRERDTADDAQDHGRRRSARLSVLHGWCPLSDFVGVNHPAIDDARPSGNERPRVLRDRVLRPGPPCARPRRTRGSPRRHACDGHR